MPTYRDAGGLTRAITILLPLYLLAGVGNTFLGWLQLRDLSSLTVQQMATRDPFSGISVVASLVSWTSSGLFIALAIVFGFWMARVHRNGSFLSGSSLPDSTGWSVGAWYIPLVGGFLALGPLLRLWARGPGGPSGKPRAWATLFALHQVVSFLVGVVAFVIVFRSAMQAAVADSPSPLNFLQGFGDRYIGVAVVLFALYATAGACMWLTVNAIQSWQAQAAARMGAGRPMTAPAPPAAWR